MRPVTVEWWDLTPIVQKQLAKKLPKDYVKQLNDISNGFKTVTIDWDSISPTLRGKIATRMSSRQINKLWNTFTDAYRTRVASNHINRKVLTPEHANAIYLKAKRWKWYIVRAQPFIDEKYVRKEIKSTGWCSCNQLLKERQLSRLTLDELWLTMVQCRATIVETQVVYQNLSLEELPKFLTNDIPEVRYWAKNRIDKLRGGKDD